MIWLDHQLIFWYWLYHNNLAIYESSPIMWGGVSKVANSYEHKKGLVILFQIYLYYIIYSSKKNIHLYFMQCFFTLYHGVNIFSVFHLSVCLAVSTVSLEAQWPYISLYALKILNKEWYFLMNIFLIMLHLVWI